MQIGHKDHPLVKDYLEKLKKYQEDFQEMIGTLPKKDKIRLPELKPIKSKSLYSLFKERYLEIHKVAFDEKVNNGEPKEFVYTLILYFIGNYKFLQSPLLNNKSEPKMHKGLLMVGGMGVGKSSVMKTFHSIFFEAQTNPIMVEDISGTMQYLGRYEIRFSFHTANNVWNQYKKIAMHDRKSDEEYSFDLFWKTHSKGKAYYDDLMTEETMRVYGETIEIFKKILEERYDNKALTMISLNYTGETLDDTLEDFSKKYGERLYDRIFERYNIIELKGETLRK